MSPVTENPQTKGLIAMDMELNNQLVQIQTTVITQKLIEYFEILQMPCLELAQHIQEMSKGNPLIEYDASENYLEGLLEIKKKNCGERFESISLEDHPDGDEFLSYARTGITLRDYLKLQLLELKIRPLHKKITEFLIENIDTDGYLREEINELACMLKVSAKLVKRCLKILQDMEPAGVCARDLKECLLLQLKRKKLLSRNVICIIVHYFDMLANRSFSRISRETGIEKEQVEYIYYLVKSLNPKPGAAFQKNEWDQYIIPDIILREDNGKYILLFNDESIPSVRINNYYVDLLKNSESNRELKKYIKKNLSAAVTLVKSIEQRKKTILDIAGYIAAFQEDFFKKGFEYLKPFTMKMAADRLGINVSTVSRAVNGKFIQTPRGIYQLKFFFSSELKTESENKMSAVSVKDIIRRIVLEEDKRNPLSDEQIKEKLESMGIKAARRTIAKYREELSILPSAMRKC